MTLVAGHTAGVKWKSVPALLVQWGQAHVFTIPCVRSCRETYSLSSVFSLSLSYLSPGGRSQDTQNLQRRRSDHRGSVGAYDISYPRLVLCISILLSGPQNRMLCGLGLGGWSVTIPVRSKRGRPSSLCNPPLTWHGCPRPWRRHAESTWYVEQMVPPLKITMLYHTPRHSRGLRQKGVRVGVGAARCSHQPSVRGQMQMQPPGEHGPRGP